MKKCHRNYRVNRFLSHSQWFTNSELRNRMAETKLSQQRFAYGTPPIFNTKIVRNRWQDLDFKDIKYSCDLRLELPGIN